MIKGKKQAVSDAELQLKKLEHDVQTLVKEKTAATNFVANLEKQYDWIQDESECVIYASPEAFMTYVRAIVFSGGKGRRMISARSMLGG